MSVPAYQESASRFEYCIMRCLYAIPLFIVGGIASIFMMIAIGILNFVNFFTILFMGNRLEGFYNMFRNWQMWLLQVNFYMAGATDERPPLHPF